MMLGLQCPLILTCTTLDEINTTCSLKDTQKVCVTWLQNNGYGHKLCDQQTRVLSNTFLRNADCERGPDTQITASPPIHNAMWLFLLELCQTGGVQCHQQQSKAYEMLNLKYQMCDLQQMMPKLNFMVKRQTTTNIFPWLMSH